MSEDRKDFDRVGEKVVFPYERMREALLSTATVIDEYAANYHREIDPKFFNFGKRLGKGKLNDRDRISSVNFTGEIAQKLNKLRDRKGGDMEDGYRGFLTAVRMACDYDENGKFQSARGELLERIKAEHSLLRNGQYPQFLAEVLKTALREKERFYTSVRQEETPATSIAGVAMAYVDFLGFIEKLSNT